MKPNIFKLDKPQLKCLDLEVNAWQVHTAPRISGRCFQQQGQCVTGGQQPGGGQLLLLIQGSVMAGSELTSMPFSGSPHVEKWPQQLQTSRLVQLSSKEKQAT